LRAVELGRGVEVRDLAFGVHARVRAAGHRFTAVASPVHRCRAAGQADAAPPRRSATRVVWA
ncbi:hypothetical protein, partial [Nocardia farcinica]|uniref:hypothetical protein n=1 Tax=Nocardia farcinica TaxID=37329 RepID=UPI002453C8C4